MMKAEKPAFSPAGWPPLTPAAAVAALMLALGACAPRPEPAAEAASVQEPAPLSIRPAPTTGEAPADLLNAIVDDLAAQEQVNREDIEVERAESVIWPSGALGCPEPGVMYTQAQVPGYWVVLRVGDKQFDYRASGKGHFRRCKPSFKIQLPVG